MGAISMEQSSILHPMATNNYYTTEHESQDPLGVHNAHQVYHEGTIHEQMRRDDGLSQTHSGSYSVAESHVPNYLPERVSVVDNQFTSKNFTTGDTSGSISSATTPGSAASSLVQTFTQPYHLNYASQYFPSTGFGPRSVEEPGHSYGSWRADSASVHPVSPTSNSREHYAYQNTSPGLVPSQVTYASSNAAYPTTPRSVELVQPYTPATSIFENDMPTNSHEHSHLFPFLEVEHERAIQTATGETIRPNIHAMATKGFFLAQNHWTCYRRNYFGLNAWYDVGAMPHNTPLFLDGRQIQSFAMHLTASIEGQEEKEIELIQYTPKRDLGEKTAITTTKVAPSAPVGHAGITPGYHAMSTFPFPGMMGFPYLPLQNERESESPESPNSITQGSLSSRGSRYSQSNGQGQVDIARHSFDRVQFKGATQNNGKRRASQQFYILIVELMADVREEGAKTPDWKRVASRPSDKLVVRGRSPSHYKDSDGRVNSHTGRGGHQGNYSVQGPHGSPGGGQGGASAYHSGAGNPGAFRPSYSYNHSSMSPTSSYSTTSPSSNGDTMIDIKHQIEPVLTREDLAHMQNTAAYRYYPDTLYEGTPVPFTKLESPLPGIVALEKADSKIAIAEEYPHAVASRHWANGSYAGYLGSDGSHGWFPELHGGCY